MLEGGGGGQFLTITMCVSTYTCILVQLSYRGASSFFFSCARVHSLQPGNSIFLLSSASLDFNNVLKKKKKGFKFRRRRTRTRRTRRRRRKRQSYVDIRLQFSSVISGKNPDKSAKGEGGFVQASKRLSLREQGDDGVGGRVFYPAQITEKIPIPSLEAPR